MKIKAILLSVVAVASLTVVSCAKKDAAKPDAAQSAEKVEIEKPSSDLHVFNDLKSSLNLTADLPVVIDFNATWCGPCKRFAPTFEAASETYKDKAQFVSVDIDKNPELAAQFGVESIPTIIVVTPSDQISANVGFMTPEAFDAFLAKSF